MRIAIGCDGAGFPLKAPIISALESAGHVVLDLGSFSIDPVDYPDYARVVAHAVLRGFADTGVLVCGNGVGASIAANKVRSVRAAFCPDAATARQSREQDDANVLCLSANDSDASALLLIARAWLDTRFSAQEAHTRRIAKIAHLEAEMPGMEARSAPPVPAAPPPIPSPPDPRRPADGPARVPSGVVADRGTAGPAPPRARTKPDALEAPLVEQALAELESHSFLDRLWTKDTTLWNGDAAGVGQRLGWLTAPAIMRTHVEHLRTFADEIRRLQYSQIVVLGAGGSSLAAEVLGQTFASKIGFPDLLVLDSTDPGAIKHALDRVNVPRTLFVVSSKSGTTPETLALYRFCRQRVESTSTTKPGMQFIAITDPDTPLATMAKEAGFRHAFLNPTSIGGRYAALSFFGLVPAALIGVDLKALLERARAMVDRSGTTGSVHESAAVRLGAALAAFAKAGQDKLTFVLSDEIRALGAWLEQLVAESLGKNGAGVVPVVDEPLGNPTAYSSDRLFVALTLAEDTSHDAALAALAETGHPVVRIELGSAIDVGAEFFRWELAVATAGALLGVNPFDEPDVARAQAATVALLAQWSRAHRLPEWPAVCQEETVVLAAKGMKAASVAEGITTHLAQVRPGDYLAFLVYLEPSPDVLRPLQALRLLLRDRLGVATTLGFGPRYLHSTGQLHKGGPPSGLFIQITGADPEDLPIPDTSYGFSTLKAAQALGDLEALHAGGRRVIRLHLQGKPAAALEHLLQTVRTASRKL